MPGKGSEKKANYAGVLYGEEGTGDRKNQQSHSWGLRSMDLSSRNKQKLLLAWFLEKHGCFCRSDLATGGV